MQKMSRQPSTCSVDKTNYDTATDKSDITNVQDIGVSCEVVDRVGGGPVLLVCRGKPVLAVEAQFFPPRISQGVQHGRDTVHHVEVRILVFLSVRSKLSVIGGCHPKWQRGSRRTPTQSIETPPLDGSHVVTL